MKKRLPTMILILVFTAGLSLILYPTVSDWWNSFHSSQAVASYVQAMANVGDEERAIIWEEAQDFNRRIYKSGGMGELTEAQMKQYESILDVGDNGIMGYIEIDSIKVQLPIYHGTDEAVLAIAVGHIAGSSLPVGGPGTHCVLSGHRGLPSARLFTDIDRLVVGDTFLLQVLDETLTYEVDQIRTVLPYEIQDLQIVPGEDYCSLVTCTPYGINSHRLLVRGHRVDTVKVRKLRVTADALQVDPTLVAVFIGGPLLAVMMIIALLMPKKPKIESDEELP